MRQLLKTWLIALLVLQSSAALAKPGWVAAVQGDNGNLYYVPTESLRRQNNIVLFWVYLQRATPSDEVIASKAYQSANCKTYQ